MRINEALLDTAAMIAAIRSDSGASRRLLRAALQGQGVTLLLSVPLLIEYEAVMTRAEHLSAAGLTVGEVGSLLDAVAGVAERVRLAFLWRPLLPDIDDDMVLETAVNGRADAIVTFNRRDFALATEQFGIAVLASAEALSRVGKEQ